jgi:hypothetical protein
MGDGEVRCPWAELQLEDMLRRLTLNVLNLPFAGERGDSVMDIDRFRQHTVAKRMINQPLNIRSE